MKKTKKAKELEPIEFYDAKGNYYVNGEILIRSENIHD